MPEGKNETVIHLIPQRSNFFLSGFTALCGTSFPARFFPNP